MEHVFLHGILLFIGLQKCYNKYYPLNWGNLYVKEKEDYATKTIPSFFLYIHLLFSQEILLNMYYVAVMCYLLRILWCRKIELLLSWMI